MAISYSTARGQVRLLISDVDEANLILDDDMIDGYLGRYGVTGTAETAPRWDVERAAADALDAIASSEALVSKVIRTGDGLSTNGPAVAAELRKHADRLRARADRDEEDSLGSFFDVVEFSPYGRPGHAEATETAWSS